MRLIKTIYDKRLAYLDSLAKNYREMNYEVQVNGRENLLLIYQKENNICQETLKPSSKPAFDNWIG